jgi:membrane protease YdiL (CAAX protease family)
MKAMYRILACDSSGQYEQLLSRVLLVIAPFFLVGLLNGFYIDALSAIPWLYWTVDIVSWVALPLFILYYMKCQYGLGLRDYGIELFSDPRRNRETLTWSLMATLLLAIYYFGLAWLTRLFFPEVSGSGGYAGMVPTGAMRLSVVIYLAATAAIFEEIFFRGMLRRIIFANFAESVATLLYVLGSSILFGLVHWENGTAEVLTTMVTGMVSCFLYLRMNNLVPLIVAHFLIDLVVFW